MEQVSSQHPTGLVLDEFGYLFHDDSNLREALREMPGVPGVRYQVDGDRVFVFDRLVGLVSDHGLGADRKPDPAKVAKLLPSAWLSADEAVQAGVVPEPYEVAQEGGLYRVRHRHFDAWLPGVHREKQSADRDLAQLLLGRVISGQGDFNYRGQAMSLVEPYDLSKLSFKLQLRVERNGVAQDHWAMPKFVDGLAPLTATTYATIAETYQGWHADRAALIRLAKARSHALWGRAAELQFDQLNDADSSVPEYRSEDAAALRGCYPELAMLNDGSLCDLFGEFAEDCLMARRWMPYRHEDFLFYLLGIHAVGADVEGEEIREAGYSVAAGLSEGLPLDEAVRIAAAASSHARTVCSMALRARKAVQFLESEVTRDWRVGPRVSTMNDLYRMGRSTGFIAWPSASRLLTEEPLTPHGDSGGHKDG